MSLLQFIADAFANRTMPAGVTEEHRPESETAADAQMFQGRQWQETTSVDWERHFDAIYGFSPAAFCYFLPGIFSAGISENRPELLVNHSIVMMLDRGNVPSSWDSFFSTRWTMLTPVECEATQRWLLWLTEADPPVFIDGALARAYDTVAVLANLKHATPMAMWSPKGRAK